MHAPTASPPLCLVTRKPRPGRVLVAPPGPPPLALAGLAIVERINNTQAARTAWEAAASTRLYNRSNRTPVHVLPLPNSGPYQHLVLDVEPLNPATAYFLGFDVGACERHWHCQCQWQGNLAPPHPAPCRPMRLGRPERVLARFQFWSCCCVSRA
jgi:hypothetical protein